MRRLPGVVAAYAVPVLADRMGDQPASTVPDGGAAPRPRVTTHGPVLPIWSCGGCDAPWPCRTRQRELHAEFDDAPISLALYLSAQLVRASEDLTWVPVGALHRRFLGWLR
jgi:hypothetical protein